MKKITILGVVLLLTAGAVVIWGCRSIGTKVGEVSSNFPFPQHAAFNYANNPVLPTTKTQSQMDKIIVGLFREILLNNLIVDENGPQNKDEFRMVNWHSLAYEIQEGMLDHSHINVSESMGYGMLMMAYMAGCEKDLRLKKKEWIFGCTSIKEYYDAMLRTVLEYPSIIAPNLFTWQLYGHTDKGTKFSEFIEDWESENDGYTGFAINKDGVKTAPFTRDSEDGDSATDGDMDIIYSLIIADKQWGSDGRYNYLEIARAMLNDLWQYCVHPVYKTLLLGDWASKGGDKGDNTLSAMQMSATRPSDFIISHLKAYQAVDSAHNWQEVINATYGVIKDVYANVKVKHGASRGLLPDFVIRNNAGTVWIVPEGFVLEDEDSDGKYAYNACRVPWRLGTDYLLYGGNVTVPGLNLFSETIVPLNKLAAEIYESADADIFGPLDLAGYGFWSDDYDDPDYDWHNWNDPQTFTAPFLVTAAAAGDQKLVNNLWNWEGLEEFWCDTWGDYIKIIVMLTASGNYWKP
jgi:hypothetical protein